MDGMEATAAFQEKCWRAGFPVFTTIPKAAASIARTYRWRLAREDAQASGPLSPLS
jgi:hypothetical protein